jgi:hypothetical protein
MSSVVDILSSVATIVGDVALISGAVATTSAAVGKLFGFLGFGPGVIVCSKITSAGVALSADIQKFLASVGSLMNLVKPSPAAPAPPSSRVLSLVPPADKK